MIVTLGLEPDPHAAAQRRLAMQAEASGDLAAALHAYDLALEAAPGQVDLLQDLGRLALRMAEPAIAEAFYRRHLAARPVDPASQDGLGRALRDQHRYGEAVELLRAAILADPGEPILWNTLGTVLSQAGQVETALAFFDEALRLAPGFAQALYNRSCARMDGGGGEAALDDCEAAIALAAADAATPPADLAVMRFARATLLLAEGRLAQGWAAYEARAAPGFPGRAEFHVEAPRWTPAQPLSGLALLLVGEQGLGDEVMFASLIPDVLKALGPQGRLGLAVEPRLVALLQRRFPQAVVGPHATTREGLDLHRRVPDLSRYGAVDAWAPIGALLQPLRRSLAAFADPVAVLTPDLERTAHWRRLLSARSGPQVGFTWRSGLLTGERRRQYASPADWAGALRGSGVGLVNLQYGDCEDDLAELAAHGVDVWRPPELDLRQDLEGLAALSSALDLVIGCSNATTHLAAACGAQTWIVSPPGTWPMLGTDRLPWHPRTRGFVAPRFDAWPQVLAQVAGALRRGDWL